MVVELSISSRPSANRFLSTVLVVTEPSAATCRSVVVRVERTDVDVDAEGA